MHGSAEQLSSLCTEDVQLHGQKGFEPFRQDCGACDGSTIKQAPVSRLWGVPKCKGTCINTIEYKAPHKSAPGQKTTDPGPGPVGAVCKQSTFHTSLTPAAWTLG